MCSLTVYEFLGSKKLVCFILPSLDAWDSLEISFQLENKQNNCDSGWRTTVGHLIFITLIFFFFVKSK